MNDFGKKLGAAMETFLGSEVLGKPSHQVVPEAAVEAAAELIYRTSGRRRVQSYESAAKECRSEALEILEAAAPHMLAGALEEVADALEAAPYETLECYASIRDWPDALNVNHGLQAGTRYLRARADTYRPTP